MKTDGIGFATCKYLSPISLNSSYHLEFNSSDTSEFAQSLRFQSDEPFAFSLAIFTLAVISRSDEAPKLGPWTLSESNVTSCGNAGPASIRFLPTSSGVKSVWAKEWQAPFTPLMGDPVSISSRAPGNNLPVWQSAFRAGQRLRLSPRTGNVGTRSLFLVSLSWEINEENLDTWQTCPKNTCTVDQFIAGCTFQIYDKVRPPKWWCGSAFFTRTSFRCLVALFFFSKFVKDFIDISHIFCSPLSNKSQSKYPSFTSLQVQVLTLKTNYALFWHKNIALNLTHHPPLTADV